MWYLHIVEDTPSTVRVSGAQTLPTSGVLLTALHWDSHHLGRQREGEKERGREQGGDEEIISILIIKLVKQSVYSAGWRRAFDSFSDGFSSANRVCVCAFVHVCVLVSDSGPAACDSVQ